MAFCQQKLDEFQSLTQLASAFLALYPDLDLSANASALLTSPPVMPPKAVQE
jgi:hypothetical protein